jgi:hypothetical protein
VTYHQPASSVIKHLHVRLSATVGVIGHYRLAFVQRAFALLSFQRAVTMELKHTATHVFDKLQRES